MSEACASCRRRAFCCSSRIAKLCRGPSPPPTSRSPCATLPSRARASLLFERHRFANQFIFLYFSSCLLIFLKGEEIARKIDDEVQRQFLVPPPITMVKAIAMHPLRTTNKNDDDEYFVALRFQSEENIEVLSPPELLYALSHFVFARFLSLDISYVIVPYFFI